MEDKAKYSADSLGVTKSNFIIDQIASPGNEWFLIHYLDEGEQSIYPVAVWAIHNGEVIGLISVKHKEGRLVGPPPG